MVGSDGAEGTGTVTLSLALAVPALPGWLVAPLMGLFILAGYSILRRRSVVVHQPS